MGRLRSYWLLQVLDAVVYVVVATTVSMLVAGLLWFGGGLQFREALFVVGILQVVVGAAFLRPSRPMRSDREDDDGEDSPARVQRWVAGIVTGQEPLARGERPPSGVRLVLSGSVVLAVTYASEYLVG